MEPQASLIDFGCTKGVEQRIRLSLPTVAAAKAFEPAFREAVRRKFEAQGRDTDMFDDEHISPCLAEGLEIEALGREMAAADRELQRARVALRELWAERDAVRARAYEELSSYREFAREQLAPAVARDIRCLNGDTQRAPYSLLAQARQVISWATNAGDALPLRLEEGVAIRWPETVSDLVKVRDELQDAVEQVEGASAELAQPLEARILAIRAFDKGYAKRARFLERAFEQFGLPTLAVAVRPHLKGTGRVGRPSRVPAADKHPDLVAAALAALDVHPLPPEPSAEPAPEPETAPAPAPAPEPEPVPAEAGETAPTPEPRRRIVRLVPPLRAPLRAQTDEPGSSPRRRKARRRPVGEKIARRRRRGRENRRSSHSKQTRSLFWNLFGRSKPPRA